MGIFEKTFEGNPDHSQDLVSPVKRKREKKVKPSTERSRRFRARMKERGIVEVRVRVPQEKAEEVKQKLIKPRSKAAIKKAAYRARKKAQGYVRFEFFTTPEHRKMIQAYARSLTQGKST